MAKASRDKGKRSARGKQNRRRGREFQAELANRLKPAHPRAHSGAQYRGASACSPDVAGLPWWLEAKHGDHASPQAALRQAEKESDGRPAIAVVKRNGTRAGEEIVAMRWNTLAGLLGIPEAHPKPRGGKGGEPSV